MIGPVDGTCLISRKRGKSFSMLFMFFVNFLPIYEKVIGWVWETRRVVWEEKKACGTITGVSVRVGELSLTKMMRLSGGAEDPTEGWGLRIYHRRSHLRFMRQSLTALSCWEVGIRKAATWIQSGSFLEGSNEQSRKAMTCIVLSNMLLKQRSMYSKWSQKENTEERGR